MANSKVFDSPINVKDEEYNSSMHSFKLFLACHDVCFCACGPQHHLCGPPQLIIRMLVIKYTSVFKRIITVS